VSEARENRRRRARRRKRMTSAMRLVIKAIEIDPVTGGATIVLGKRWRG
jgi:hypothetical protein